MRARFVALFLSACGGAVAPYALPEPLPVCEVSYGAAALGPQKLACEPDAAGAWTYSDGTPCNEPSMLMSCVAGGVAGKVLP